MIINLQAPILPEGVTITADINNGDLTAGLDRLKQAITFVHDEADVNRTATPGERSLTNRLDKFEKLIISGLDPATKLGIANDAARSPLR